MGAKVDTPYGYDALVMVFYKKLQERKDRSAKEFAEAALDTVGFPKHNNRNDGQKRGLAAAQLWKHVPDATAAKKWEDDFPRTKAYLFANIIEGYLWAQRGSETETILARVVLDQGYRTEKEREAISQGYADALNRWVPEEVARRLAHLLGTAEPDDQLRDNFHMIGRSLAHFVSVYALVEFGKAVLALPPDKQH